MAVLGQVVLRALRRRGEVRCEVRGWRIVPMLRDETGGGLRHIGANETVPDSYDGPARCYFRVYLFNERDLGTALLDLSVTFRWKDGQTASFPALEGASDLLTVGEVLALDLPPRKAVTKDMMLSIANPEGWPFLEAEGVQFRGYFPDGKPFTKAMVG